MNEKQILFKKIDRHLAEDPQPSLFLSSLTEPAFFQPPFSMLSRLKDIAQSPVYHPEGNVFNHTMLVTDQAALRKGESENPRAFLWAALLHDIGKAETTNSRRGKITSYNHDKVGARMAEAFLCEFTDDSAFVRRVCALIRWHMQILFVTKDLPFAEVEEMKREVRPEEIALLCLCDRLGRKGADREAEEENVRLFLKKCKESKPRDRRKGPKAE